MATELEQQQAEIRTVGRRLGAEVEALTGKKLADLEGYYPGDMLERPVRIKATGVDASVVDFYPGEGMIVVQAVTRISPEECRDIGEPCEVSLAEVIALCVHCWEPLVESEWTAPGVCLNGECFLCGIDGEEGRVY